MRPERLCCFNTRKIPTPESRSRLSVDLFQRTAGLDVNTERIRIFKLERFFDMRSNMGKRGFVALAIGITVLMSLQVPSTSSDVSEDAKAKVETALDHLVIKLVNDRPVDPAAYVIRLTEYLNRHPEFYGAAAALLDENQHVNASPYVYRDANGIHTLDLATPDYDIENQAWFAEPLAQNGAIWTEPYFDEGGGEIWMITRSVLASDANGIFAIVTTDLPIDAPHD